MMLRSAGCSALPCQEPRFASFLSCPTWPHQAWLGWPQQEVFSIPETNPLWALAEPRGSKLARSDVSLVSGIANNLLIYALERCYFIFWGTHAFPVWRLSFSYFLPCVLPLLHYKNWQLARADRGERLGCKV